MDPWGNVFLPGYGDHLSHVVCRTASPLCAPAQVGTMQLVAGCARSTSNTGTTGSGLDNTPGFSVSNGNANAAFNNHGSACSDLAGGDQYAAWYHRWRSCMGMFITAETATAIAFPGWCVGPLTSAYFSGNNPDLCSALGVHYAVGDGRVIAIVYPVVESWWDD